MHEQAFPNPEAGCLGPTVPAVSATMSQSLTHLLVHVVFSTAGREAFLNDSSLRAELHDYLGGLVAHHGGKSLGVGGVADHVHLLVVLPKTLALCDLVRDLKRGSSLWIKKRAPSLRSFAWQGGYGAFSVGQGEVEIVRAYIAHQEQHHRKRTFQDEYRAFLTKYGIDFDERYVWD
jgi:REP element-mobilizing transposase RayT